MTGGFPATQTRTDSFQAQIEEQLYQAETRYLEDTSGMGNVIRGFENYIKNSAAGPSGGGAGRRKTIVNDADRIFSRSSASFNRESSPDSMSQPSHAPTPTRDSNAPTPTSTTGNKAGANLKRTKKGEKDEDDSESKPPKRLKMTFARGDKSGD